MTMRYISLHEQFRGRFFAEERLGLIVPVPLEVRQTDLQELYEMQGHAALTPRRVQGTVQELFQARFPLSRCSDHP